MRVLWWTVRQAEQVGPSNLRKQDHATFFWLSLGGAYRKILRLAPAYSFSYQDRVRTETTMGDATTLPLT